MNNTLNKYFVILAVLIIATATGMGIFITHLTTNHNFYIQKDNTIEQVALIEQVNDKAPIIQNIVINDTQKDAICLIEKQMNDTIQSYIQNKKQQEQQAKELQVANTINEITEETKDNQITVEENYYIEYVEPEYGNIEDINETEQEHYATPYNFGYAKHEYGNAHAHDDGSINELQPGHFLLHGRDAIDFSNIEPGENIIVDGIEYHIDGYIDYDSGNYDYIELKNNVGWNTVLFSSCYDGGGNWARLLYSYTNDYVYDFINEDNEWLNYDEI